MLQHKKSKPVVPRLRAKEENPGERHVCGANLVERKVDVLLLKGFPGVSSAGF
jgi:hypothetical protein